MVSQTGQYTPGKTIERLQLGSGLQKTVNTLNKTNNVFATVRVRVRVTVGLGLWLGLGLNIPLSILLTKQVTRWVAR